MPEVQESTPIQELYNSLSAKQPQIKERGFDGFVQDMKDDDNSKALFESLSKQQPEIGKRGYDGFKTDMFGGTQPDQPEASRPQALIQKELSDKGLIQNETPTPQQQIAWANARATPEDYAPTKQQSKFTPENIQQGKQLENQFTELYDSLNVEFGKEDLAGKQARFAPGQYPGADARQLAYMDNTTKEQRKKKGIQSTTKELYKKGMDYAHAVANGDANGAVKLWNGLTTIDLENLITVGVKGMSQDIDILGASNRYSKGEATTEDKNLLVAKAMLDEVSSLAQNDRMISVGSGLADMAPWLAQFALTGGIGSTAVKTTEKLLLTQLGKSMLAKGAAKAGAVIAGTTAQTLAQVPRDRKSVV